MRLSSILEKYKANARIPMCPEYITGLQDPDWEANKSVGIRKADKLRTVTAVNNHCSAWNFQVDWSAYIGEGFFCLWKCAEGPHLQLVRNQHTCARHHMRPDASVCRVLESNTAE